MKRVVSVSLGSKTRDHSAEFELLGETVHVSRIGTDGSLDTALRLLRELDGTVDAIGLGGIDVYLYAGRKRYGLRDGLRLRDAVRQSPVVDGSGVKNTLERNAVAYLRDALGMPLSGANVLMVSALDRFGLAQALHAAGARMLFGDFIFALDIDKPVRNLDEFETLADTYLPDACKLPFQFFYPTGKRQERPSEPKYPQYYAEADIIAGDFHFMRRFMPDRIDGKTVLTNTMTSGDLADLAARGAARCITTTPEIGGRSFGANVLEAAFAAVSGTRPNDRDGDDADGGSAHDDAYAELIARAALRPRVVEFA